MRLLDLKGKLPIKPPAPEELCLEVVAVSDLSLHFIGTYRALVHIRMYRFYFKMVPPNYNHVYNIDQQLHL